MRPTTRTAPVALLVVTLALVGSARPLESQIRARSLGVHPGVFEPGPHNAITDVPGVRVGHRTLIGGDSVRTGVTAILPHGGNLFLDRVPAALHIGNAFGKLIGGSQLTELGELETPILLTCTLCVWRAADALAEWMLSAAGMEEVRSINPVVAETNDGRLNAIRSRPIEPEVVVEALEGAQVGAVAEGSVGAGTGTIAFGWKGGIGTSSRVLPSRLGGWTLGVLVQANFGGVLRVMGAPVGEELGRHAFQGASDSPGDGSIVIVVATNAPLSDRNLRRLAARGMLGLGLTGASGSNGSGDYVIAFATAEEVRRRRAETGSRTIADLPNDQMSALFQAMVEATEESIYNALFMATTVSSRGATVEAIPLDRVRQILKRHGVAP